MCSETGKTYCSGCSTGNFEFTWTIKNFSTLNTDINQGYISDRYHPYGNAEDDYYWRLSIYPGGNSDATAGSILLFLSYNHSYVKRFYVFGTFNVVNAKEEKLCRFTLVKYLNCGKISGFPLPLERDELMNKLQGDTMIINVKVNYSISNIHGNLSKVVVPGVPLHGKLHQELKALLNDGKTSDAVISVEGVDIAVHTTILSARSKIFAAMFQQETIENTSHRVEITDFEIGTMISLLEFIYAASVSYMSVDLALELLKAADKYDLCDLMEYCCNYLIARRDDKNIIQILTIADMCNASKLREHAIEYFCRKKMKFGSEEELSSLISSPTLLFDIIKRWKTK